MIALLGLMDTSFLGVYAKASDSLVILPPGAPDAVVGEISRVLGVEPLRVTVGGSSLVGVFAALNSHGVLLPEGVTEEELRILRSAGLNVAVLRERHNALGNNIMVNDRRALVHPSMGRASLRAIEDALDVEAMRSSLGGVPTVGSFGIATNRGVLVHPGVSDAEMEKLRHFFGLPVHRTTVNMGSPKVGAGILANSRGAVIGFESTPIEVARIEDALDLL